MSERLEGTAELGLCSCSSTFCVTREFIILCCETTEPDVSMRVIQNRSTDIPRKCGGFDFANMYVTRILHEQAFDTLLSKYIFRWYYISINFNIIFISMLLEYAGPSGPTV